MQIDQQLLDRAKSILEGDPTISQRALLAALGKAPNYQDLAKEIRRRLGYPENKPGFVKPADPPAIETESPLDERVLDAIKRRRGKASETIIELANRLDCSPKAAELAVGRLKAQGFAIEVSAGSVTAGEVRPGSGGVITHDIGEYDRNWSVIGATGDWHMGSHWERLDVVKTLYDIYENEGVRAVYNTGNWIEGECRLNRLDVKVHGMSPQIDYWIENTPQKKGITTYFVAGDDHEGWYQKAFGVNIGQVAADRAKAAGRDDLVFLGYVEADVELKTKRGTRMMRVMHPGGGSAYAHSYAPQKIVESFQGGEKPHVLLIGHYHKFEYCYPREVHVVQTGCAVDQSIFMRKQKIQAMVGGCLIWINQAEDGVINRFRAEWLPFYDRNFHQNRRDFNAAMRRAA